MEKLEVQRRENCRHFRCDYIL